MKALQIMLAAFAVMLSVSGCASGAGLSENQKLALYRANAGPAVPSFHYFGTLDGWTPLGDQAVAVWTRLNEAYLLEVDGPCPDLDFAQAIGLTHQSGTVYARFDSVIPRVGGGRTQPLPCHIREILPLDEKALKAAEKDIRHDAKAPAG
ncbi:DUF6491 family protein [Lysobacter niabensis]|uniref:DUF6491 family protein n=1 Tax=Agrilutibacter niabensis TaxID=380628 RepID=UPI0036142CFE